MTVDGADPFADLTAAARRRRRPRGQGTPPPSTVAAADGTPVAEHDAPLVVEPPAPVVTSGADAPADSSPPTPARPPDPASSLTESPDPAPSARLALPGLPAPRATSPDTVNGPSTPSRTARRGGSAAATPPSRPAGPARTDRGAADWELFLMRLRYREGRVVRAAGNTPIVLDDPESAWIVFSGSVDVFSVRIEEGGHLGPRRHLFRADDGTVLFGLGAGAVAGGRPIALMASGGPGVQLVRVRRASLERLAASADLGALVAALLDRWIEGLSAVIARGLPPRELLSLTPGTPLTLTAGQAARPRGIIAWVRLPGQPVLVAGRPDLAVTASAPLPVAPLLWLQAGSDSGAVELAPQTTAEALATGGAWAGLDVLHRITSDSLVADAADRARAARERLDRRVQDERASLSGVYTSLSAMLTPRSAGWKGAAGGDALLAACQLVGNALGVTVRAARPSESGREEPLAAIARASRIRTRRVLLRGAWWTTDAGPLLGYLAEDRQPVALLPTSDGRYDLYDPLSGRKVRVTPAVAETLHPAADMFYRTFESRVLTGRDLVVFGLRGGGRDLAAILLTVLAAGALGMATPLATQQIFDQAIPGAQRSLLLQMGLALLVAAVASLLFQVTREFAILRLSSRLDGAVQAAVMDRLIELSPTFFRSYSAGDLGMRAMGINAIREVLARAALSSIITSGVSLVSFGLLFYYDTRLALVATGLVLVLVVVTACVVTVQIRHQRVLSAIGGRLAGTILQLISGIAKLRVAGAESRAFVHWANSFAAARAITFQDGLIASGMATFNAVYPILTTTAIFGALAMSTEDRPSIGSFLAFNAAFGQFVTGALGLIGAATSVLQIIPTYERALPILEAMPEVDAEKADPGELSGAIDLDHISFRYGDNGPLVLDDVSIHIRPGEMVAIVGPSGSGKSTLLRLLLGFDTPEAGTILFDGRDLRMLDVRAVRRQIGTVLQNGRLWSGDIFTNIVGSSLLTIDDAWQAAKMAGLDDDIRNMPMGMHTLVSEGGGNLSGGQRQRLMIARAIVNRPRMVFFDEATSALDNRTQETVSRSLEALAATRVIVAHRLSTIVNADRIFVLQRGRVVESGTYRELMQRRGLFAELARRQLA